MEYYDKSSRMVLSDAPFFNNEEDLIPNNIQEPIIFEEWKTYFVRFYENIPNSFKKIKELPFISKKFENIKLFEINFQNYTGISRLCNLNIYVENKKIGEKLYENLLSYISDKFANLIFAFDESCTASNYKSEISDNDIPYLKFFLIKSYLSQLEGIYNLIIKEPHRQIVQEEHPSDLSHSDYLNVTSINKIFLNQNFLTKIPENHRLSNTKLYLIINNIFNKSLFPAKSYQIKKFYDLDTPENRFILYFTKILYSYLDDLNKNLKNREGTYLNNDFPLKIKDKANMLENILSNPLWKEIGQLNFIPFGSTVLQKKEGYRQLFRLYSIFQLTARFDVFQNDFQNIIENKDTSLLYEYWCFFQLKDVLERKLKLKKIEFFINNETFQQNITEGICLIYKNDITFYFNKTFSGKSNESYSLNYRPDFSIIDKNGKKLLFDAKYKGNRKNGLYGVEYEGDIDGFKQEDIDKMHTYKEAINDVYGAFILYPGLKTEIFPCHNNKGSFNGVGAIALKPQMPNDDSKTIEKDNQGIKKIEDIIDEFLIQDML